jgi:3-isopropylmalate dehydrogenase
MKARIVTLPGDGIGPEVMASAETVLDKVASQFDHDLQIDKRLMGGISIDQNGTALTDETLADCLEADAVLLGAVGGPKWDDPNAKVRPEQGLLALRKEMGLFANLRPVSTHPKLQDSSPLKNEILADVDILVVRELTGGIYFGEPKCRKVNENGNTYAVDSMVYWDYEIKRIVQLACSLAEDRQGKVTSVDKANILESSRLWRQIATEVADNHPNISFNHLLVDAAAMHLITKPSNFDVLVTSNMFGDILTDEASVLTGSMGNLPSASVGESGPGLYEPIHGSAPDIAGKGIANPIGMILSTALLLRHSLKLDREAECIETSVNLALHDGCRTIDLQQDGNSLSTQQMTEAVIDRMENNVS